ncbi:MAG: hypothetical protein NTX13_06895 [Acidobacteria bacterium]|nr:hypothetical protein [Acidobacteriota bacterium]
MTVVDFGIAQAFGGGGEEVSWGTGGYRAPEQLTGAASVRSDVYALGRVAGELLPGAHGAVRRVMERVMATDPAERPESVRRLGEELEWALRGQRWGRRAVGVGVATAVAAVVWWNVGSAPRKPAALRVLTQLKGGECNPVFSPDGRLVYFSHGPSQGGRQGLSVVDVGSGQVRELTTGDKTDEGPALSPDGQWLVFRRRRGKESPALYLMPAQGGAERRVHEGEVQSYVFSGDGRHLLLTAPARPHGPNVLQTLSLETGSREAFPALSDFFDDVDVALSRDGRQVAFCRYQTAEKADLYVMPVSPQGRPTGEARRVTRMEQRMFHPSWYPDGDGLVFAAGTLTRRGLWKLRLGRDPEPVSEFTEAVEEGVVGPRGRGMVVVRNREDADLWRFRRVEDGRYAGERVASSTAIDEEPRYSADGSQVAFVSERSGAAQVWVSRADGSGAVQVSRFERADKVGVSWGPAAVLSISARLPELGPALFQVGGAGGAGLQLKLRVPQGARLLGLARDGAAAYVRVPQEKGAWMERWWLREDGRRERVGAVEAASVRESPDGKWIYFARSQANQGLYRVPRDGGAVEQVLPSLSRRTLFALRNGWIYYASPLPRLGVYRQRMSDGKNEFLFALEKPPAWGLDVSPDERSVLVSQYEYEDADLVMAEGLP